MRITIIPDEKIATIRPEVYGHFAEHLGTCIYEGVWVGENSPIPNTRGIRNDVAAALRRIKPAVVRWPGGCFADDYHWQDGIGPRDRRPLGVNAHWGKAPEPNQFGTHEFIDFCRMIGAQPYICGNVGSGTVRELRDWAEYCNWAGDSTLARLRRDNGSPEPFGVEYWGVGNENWGCGGNFSPEDYCSEFRRYASFMFDLGTPLYLIACGPSGNDLDWTRRFFTKLKKDYWDFGRIHGYAAHYYCGFAGSASEYTTEQWYEQLRRAAQMEPLVVQQRALMDAFDPARAVGLVVDEWGAWHAAAPGKPLLWQQNTIRDALAAALTLDIFNRHADKVVMSNIAQMVNVLQSMILTDGDKMLVTPTGCVYEMYAVHQGATAVRALFEADGIEYGSGADVHRLFGLAGSASVNGGSLTLSVVNPSAEAPAETRIRIFDDGVYRLASVCALGGGDIHAHNQFGEEPAVAPQRKDAPAEGRQFTHTFPPASVSVLRFEPS